MEQSLFQSTRSLAPLSESDRRICMGNPVMPMLRIRVGRSKVDSSLFAQREREMGFLFVLAVARMIASDGQKQKRNGSGHLPT